MSRYVVQILSGDDMVFSSHEVTALSEHEAENMVLNKLGWPIDWDVLHIECVYEDMDAHVLQHAEYLDTYVICPF